MTEIEKRYGCENCPLAQISCEGCDSYDKVVGATEQRVIDDKRIEELLQYLEELEAHYHDLGQYDDGKPIRRVIEYIKAMEE